MRMLRFLEDKGQCTQHTPVRAKQPQEQGVTAEKLGNKSLTVPVPEFLIAEYPLYGSAKQTPD